MVLDDDVLNSLFAKAILTNDQEALQRVFSALCPELMGFARKFVNIHTAEDTVQTAFLRILRGKENFQRKLEEGHKIGVRPYFYQVLKRLIKKHRAKKTRTEILVGEDICESMATESRQEHKELCTALLFGLSERARTLLIFRHVHGLRYREISEALGIPLGTVNSGVPRAEKMALKVAGRLGRAA